ncbi:MAG: ParA family protein [Planctomycetota bacterium]|nr:ParA family protein [Planctomycetota bacterium]
MQTIAIVNEKGGSGKTTTAVNLSAALGELNRKVLLVDLDGQAASSRWLGVEENTSFAEALWRGDGLEPIPDVIPGVSLAPGSGKLDSVAHDLRPTQGGQLRKLISQTNGFEYVIIDCPPSLGNRLIGNALLAATHAIVPVETSILALDGLKILLTTLQDIRDGFGHDIALKGVLACRFDARTKLSRFIVTELERALPGKVFRTVIRENVRVRECPASGKSILDYAPDSHAAEDYRALAREVVDSQNQELNAATGTQKEQTSETNREEIRAVSKLYEQVDALVNDTGPKSGGQTPESEKPTSEICHGQKDTATETESPAPAEMPAPPESQVSLETSNRDDQAAQPAVVIENVPDEPKQEIPPKEEEPDGDDAAEKQQDYPALRAMLQRMNETAKVSD